MRLSSLNPITLLFGPIFQKDVRTAGRKRGTYIMRAAYGGTLLALVGIVFAGMQSELVFASGVQRLQQLQTLAPRMAILVMWFQFLALSLAAPILTGPAICDEKRARTLPALMTTPLSAAQIVLGTLSSRVVQLLILALLAAPLLLAIRVFGGLDARIVFAATCMGISAALLGAALGLMFSVWHKRGTAASLFALMSLVLAMGAPSAVEGIIYSVANEREGYTIGGTPTYPFHEGVFATCTPVTLAYLTQTVMLGGAPRSVEVPWIVLHGTIGNKGVPLTLPMWAVNTVYNLVLAVLVTMYATRALRRVMLKEAAEGVVAEESGRKRKKARSPAPPGSAVAEPGLPIAAVPDESGREAAASRQVSDRPVLWREVRQATFGSRRWFHAILVLSAVGLFLLYWRSGVSNYTFSFREMLGSEGLHGAMMILGALAVMVQPVFLTAGSIAGEREGKTWETLLTTPLTGRQIMLGKFVGALRIQWFLPAVVLAHFVFVAAAGYINPLVPLFLLLIYLGPTLAFSATGQLFSLVFKRTVAAMVWNLALALTLWLGTWIALLLAAWFMDTGEGRFFDLCGGAFYALNPVAMAASISETTTPHARAWRLHDSYNISGVHDHTLSVGMFGLLVAGVFAFYCLGAAAALGISIRGFRRWSGRSS